MLHLLNSREQDSWLSLLQQKRRDAFLEQAKLHAGKRVVMALKKFAALAVLLHRLTQLKLKDFFVQFTGKLGELCVFEVEKWWGRVIVCASFAVAKKSVLLQQLGLSFEFRLIHKARPKVSQEYFKMLQILFCETIKH